MNWYKQMNFSHLSQVLFIRAMLIKMVLDKHMVYKYGQMVVNTKASGKMARHAAKVNFGMQMAIGTKVNGNTTRLMDMAYIFMLMVQSILVIGKMICNTAMAKRLGLMDHRLKVNI